MTLPLHDFDASAVPPLMSADYDARCTGCGAFRLRHATLVFPFCIKRRYVPARKILSLKGQDHAR